MGMAMRVTRGSTNGKAMSERTPRRLSWVMDELLASQSELPFKKVAVRYQKLALDRAGREVAEAFIFIAFDQHDPDQELKEELEKEAITIPVPCFDGLVASGRGRRAK